MPGRNASVGSSYCEMKRLLKCDSEDRVLIIQDVMRNGLLSVRKVLLDAKRSINQAEDRMAIMMDNLSSMSEIIRELENEADLEATRCKEDD